MSDKRNPSEQLISLIKGVAGLGNPNAYAVYKATGQPKYRPVEGTVTEEIVKGHLIGEQPIGCYFVLGAETQVGIIDCDDHEGTMQWDQMAAAARPIVEKLAEYGISAECFRSGGGAGLHIWMFWKVPQPAALVIQFLKHVIAECGFKHGSDGGVQSGVVEVFPKNKEVKIGSLGNLIALPLSRKSVPLDDNLQPIDWDNYSPPFLTQLFSPDVPEVFKVPEDKPKLAAAKHSKAWEGHSNSTLPGDEEEVRSALRFLDADDYEVWTRNGLAAKNSLGDAAFDVWDEWSSKSVKYEGREECRKVWDSFTPNGTLTIGSIFHLAKEKGWDGPKHAVVREMNERYGILTHGSSTRIIDKKASDGEVITLLGKGAFHDRLAPEKFPQKDQNGDVKWRPKAPYWLTHEHAEHFHRVIFDPNKPPGENGHEWNMWKGFAIQPKQGSWDLMQHHIHCNISGGDDERYKWMLNWMALGVQKPGLVLGTAPVLRGLPGTGKGVLANAYGHLWGVHYVSITKDDHVSGRFNQHLEGRRFVYVDEAMFGGDRKNAGVIKTMLTEPRIMIEKKGIDPVFLDNHMIFMVTSNERSVVPADIGDRRWQVIEVADTHREDRAYFAAIASQMRSGGYEAMMYDLLERDVTKGPDPQKTIRTPELFDQIIQAQGPVERYLYQVLDDAYLPQPDAPGNGAGITTIAAMYVEMKQSQPNAQYVQQTLFGRNISKVFPGVKKVGSGWVITGRDSMGQLIIGRSTRYHFPPLLASRRAFEVYIGQEIPWSNDLSEWQDDIDPGYEYSVAKNNDADTPF